MRPANIILFRSNRNTSDNGTRDLTMMADQNKNLLNNIIIVDVHVIYGEI